MGFENVWVVVAAYNEDRVLADVIRKLKEVFPNVVVVDDGSSDDSAGVARVSGADVVQHPVNLGQGAALQTGFDYALKRGASVIVTYDADGQHRPEDAALLVTALWENGWEAALGSRFLGSAVNISRFRRVFLRLAALFTAATTGVRLTDAHNGLRAMRADTVKRIRIRHNRMAHASELIEQLAKLKVRIGEVPVSILYTEYSMAKGQRLSNSVFILLDLLMGRIGR
jgi:glycosyltransferase involved in cell wall biosynthesis